MRLDSRDPARRARCRSRVALTAIALCCVSQACSEVQRELGSPEISLHAADTSCATATVLWGDGTEDDPQQVVTLPWSRSIGSPSGLVLVFAARRECDDDGTIDVEIRLDGRLADRAEASGPHATTAASTDFF